LKTLGVATRWIFIVCLPVLLLTASIGWAANSLWLYRYGYQKYEVSHALADEGLELADSKLEEIYAGLIDYYNSDEEQINFTVVKDGQQINLFTPEEVIHFRDVKGLIRLDYRVLLGTLAYAAGYALISLFWRRRRYWNQLARGVVGGTCLTLALILALGLGTITDFDQLFQWFHFISFSNEFWSAEGYMLLLFPQRFFYDAVLIGALAAAAGAVILGGVGGGYLLLTKKRKQNTGSQEEQP